MGRKSRTRTLQLWMNGTFVGRWTISPSGEHQLYYDQTWLDSPGSRPLSISLPLQPSHISHRGDKVEFFFDNLLPDSDIIRQRIQRRFGTSSQQAFDLLSELGRDCVGALQILSEGYDLKSVKSINYEPLNNEEVERILKSTTSSDFFRTDKVDDFRISIAGAQEKNALLYYKDTWAKPVGATPSTHIFKLPIGDIGNADMSTSVENEWLCMQIINAFGIRTADCNIAQFGDQKTLVVERFDRRFSQKGDWIVRIPQEDFCQATGTPAGMKYESDGGPGIKKILDFLLHSESSAVDRRMFIKTQILFWLLAATDGHAKNFSIFLQAKGNYHLTPLYDILSAYPIMGESGGLIHPKKIKMSMAVTGKSRHYLWYKIRKDHWMTTASKAGVAVEVVNQINQEIVESAPAVIETVKEKIPPGYPEYVAVSILNGLEAAVRKLSN
jgi:serine/threonine-protein kinase HipA